MADSRVAGERFAFDEDVWGQEVGRLDPDGRARVAAAAARGRIERPGSRIAVRACAADGADGTRLTGCAKVYVPLDVEPSRAPYGFVFALRSEPPSGRVMLRLIAPPAPVAERLRARPQASAWSLPRPGSWFGYHPGRG